MSNPADRTLTITKVFNAPLKLVWEAWTTPGHIAEWWAPKGMKVTIVEHDFKVGGNWKFVMPMPDGNEFVSAGQYLEIIECRKIMTTANFKPMTEGVELQVLFEEDGDKTNFTFNVVHPTEEYCKQQEQMGFYNGWGSTFNRLETLVSSFEASKQK
jgi:uncharacterized protein YndB with AHSA1/START domain